MIAPCLHKRSFLAFVCIGLLLPGLSLSALDLTVRNGPPALGGGGPNPMAIPPTNPVGYELCLTTKRSYDFCFSISPGIFAGKRFVSRRGLYTSVGGGLVIGINGVGPWSVHGIWV